MFKAIWVSTGKSASATLIHWALHAVVIRETVKTTASRIRLVDFTFMIVSPGLICFSCEFQLSGAVPGLDSRGRLSPRGSGMATKQNRHQPKPMAIL
jgi:hypothetical protein